VVHRHHLHQGLSEGARRHGVEIIIDARVTNIDYESDGPVKVTTYSGKQYEFDLLIGSDGLKSVVRKSLFPEVRPRAPTTNAAYRAVIPYEEVFSKHPDLKSILGNTINVWMAENGYAISYPISGGKDLNFVLSHHRKAKVEDVEEVNIEELHSFYRDWDPRLVKVVEMVNESKRWPLMVTGPLKSWSSPKKNVVLIGDAAHSMVNHMAQGAATSMEDGAFLGRVILEVVRGVISLPEAITLYEQKRMPRAFAKQQVSFLMGATFHLEDGPRQQVC
jgi:salicylate hydroxylase